MGDSAAATPYLSVCTCCPLSAEEYVFLRFAKDMLDALHQSKTGRYCVLLATAQKPLSERSSKHCVWSTNGIRSLQKSALSLLVSKRQKASWCPAVNDTRAVVPRFPSLRPRNGIHLDDEHRGWTDKSDTCPKQRQRSDQSWILILTIRCGWSVLRPAPCLRNGGDEIA